MKSYLTLTVIFLFFLSSYAQSESVKFSAFDGYVIAGYVDEGAFINFTGPNINYTLNDSKFVLGMLPSLRFKKDRGTTRNSFVTPNLGVGLTYSYQFWSFQIPFYYNSKTQVDDGKWHIGFGAGLRLDQFKKKQ